MGLDHQLGPSCLDDTDLYEQEPEYDNFIYEHDDHDASHVATDHGYHG